jgi:hypothetical protein
VDDTLRWPAGPQAAESGAAAMKTPGTSSYRDEEVVFSGKGKE